MHRGHDFIPRQPTHDRVEVGELIRERARAPDVGDAASDGLVPPRLTHDAAPTAGVRHDRPDTRPRRRGGLGMLALTVLAAVLLSVLGVLLVMPLGWREQAIVGALLIAGALSLSSASRAPAITMALIAVSLFATLRYAYWRVVQTWDGLTSAVQIHQWDVLFVCLLLAAECYVFATLALGYFQTLRPLRRRAAPLSGSSSQWPTVDVLIPTFNERLEDVRATALGALALEYPEGRFNVFLLDDGCRREFRQFARAVGACYLPSDYQTHSKADQINEALARTNGELVAIFDCDQVPTRSFLQMTLGWFQRDRRLGLVQTPHHFYSPDPFERNLDQFHKVPSEAALFHRLVQDGNDLWNASLCCGSCAVLRREALDDIGGIAVDTVTEDAHTAVRMQCRGWSTAYINVPQAAGPATGSLSGYITQRSRWAHGVMQMSRLENPLFARGLTLSQRLCYLSATMHVWLALPRLIFLTVPLAYLLFGTVNIYGDALALLAYVVPSLALARITTNRIQRGVRSAFWNVIYETVLAPFTLAAALRALVAPRRAPATVTTRSDVVERSYFDRRVAWPLVMLLALNVAGLIAAFQRFLSDPAPHGILIVNAIWTVYNVVILSVAASVARERRQRRHEVRLDVRVPLTLVTRDGRSFAGVSVELSRHGATGRFERPVRLARESPVTLFVRSGGSRCELDARLTSDADDRELHVVFPRRLTTAQERVLVDAMYCRPEAWVAGEDGRGNDPLLRSLTRVMWLSIRGLGIVFVGLLAPPRVYGHAMVRAGRPRKRTAVAASGFLLASVVTANIAAAPPRETANLTEPLMFRDVYELRDLAGQEVTTLQRDGGSFAYFFAVPVTKAVSDATLTLRYTAPLVAAGEVSLELGLNGLRVGTIPLVPGRDRKAEIRLPANRLTAENALTVRLMGRCQACVRARAPWVAVDNRSRLGIAGRRLPLANDLSRLPLPFIDGVSDRPRHLPVAFATTPGPEELKAAALVASWIGVHADERSVRFPVTIGEVPRGTAIVIVRREPTLDAALALPPAPRALVAMRDNPRDPYGKLLVIAGDTVTDLLKSARTLIGGDVTRTHTDVLAAYDVTLPRRGQYGAPRWLRTDRPAAIGSSMAAERMRSAGSGSINVHVRLPPDLVLSARHSVPLSLRFTYAGVAEQSEAALHVRLNGDEVGTIRLAPSSSPLTREAIVRLPTARLRPYANTLTVDTDFGQTDGSPDAAHVAIAGDSTIDLRGLPHSVVLPRLELVADAGYPFTAWPDLARTAAVLPARPTIGDVETLLNMVGFFGAQTGAAVDGLTVVGAERVSEVRDKDLIVIGTPASQPLLVEWTNRMPLGFSRDGPVINDAAGSHLWQHVLSPFRHDDRERLARLVAAGYTFDAVLEHFVSPFRADRSVVAIVAGDDDGAAAASAFTSARTGSVHGGVAVARAGRFESFQLGLTAYRAGPSDVFQRAFVVLLEHYWLMPVIVLIAAVVIGVRVHLAVERVAARRLAAGEL